MVLAQGPMTTAAPPPPTNPVSYFGSRFSRGVTLVLAILLAFFFSFVLAPATPEQRVSTLRRPVDSAVRLFERDLEIQDALDGASSWMGRVGEIVLEVSPATAADAILAYRELLTLAPSTHDADESNGAAPRSDAGRDASAKLVELRARLVVLLEESGRSADAREELARLDEAEQHDSADAGAARLADAVRAAYGERTLERRSDVDWRRLESTVLHRLGPGWARDRWMAELAERSGDTELTARLRTEAVQRGDHWRRRALLLTFALLALCLIGLAFFSYWLWRDRPEVLGAGALIPPAWSWDDGCAVLVRAAFAGMVVYTAIGLAIRDLAPSALTLQATLIASLPMMWWIHRALLAPHGLGFRNAFGLWPRGRTKAVRGLRLDAMVSESPSPEPANELPFGRRVLAWGAFVLALFAIDYLGAAVIGVLCGNFGVAPHWSEVVPENLIWPSRTFALLDSLDGTLWAPIFEEIGCRGLLYLTLRARSGPQSAALFSASIFGMVHAYSLPGFLTVTWSGYVFALAFERCKSLVPGMICHALWNGFLMASQFLFYR
jgi:membrane protease YdiL (CAAX protease family)